MRGSAIGVAAMTRGAVGVRGLACERDVLAAVEYAGATVRYFRGVRDLPGLQIGRSIWLSDDLEPGLRRYVLAHELGHVEMRHGLSLYTAPLSLYGTRAETEADAYAGTLLLGVPAGPGFDEALIDAQSEGIPDDCLVRYLNAVGPELRRLAERIG